MIEIWIARAICMAAALTIAWLAERRLDLMSDKTRPGFRMAFLVLTVGGVWQAIDLLSGVVPPWSAIAVRAGIALLLFEERHCSRLCQRVREEKKIAIFRRRSSDFHHHSIPPGSSR
jgi:hypothetical protein